MTLRRFLTEPFRARTWKETAYALLSLVLGVFWFTVLVTLISVGGGLLVVMFIGVPILLGTIALVRAGAQAERLTAAALLGLHIPAPPRRHPEGSWWRRLVTSAGDPAAWRELLYLLLLLPVGIVLFVTAVVLWSVSLALLTVPTWYMAIPSDDRGDFLWEGNRLDAVPEWIGVVGAGLLLLLLTPWILRGLLRLHGLLMRALLGPTRGELEREAARLGAERDFAVTAAAGDRRQIERDLHDGAQARLVALAVDLGRARRRLEEGGSTEEAAQLVRDAHEDAKLALAEIRDLARGIHPAVLTDRGLDAALSSLAARCPVPVAVSTDLEPRPPEPVEAAAYFVVAEALTNVARHSAAEHAAVSVLREDGSLRVEVRDDGRGGAELRPDSGLAGLRDRVGALGGRLQLESPPGGPTILTAVIPCA